MRIIIFRTYAFFFGVGGDAGIFVPGAGAGAFWWSLGEGKGRGLEGVDQVVRKEKKGGGCGGCGGDAIM